MANSVSAGGPGWARPAAILSVGYHRKVDAGRDVMQDFRSSDRRKQGAKTGGKNRG